MEITRRSVLLWLSLLIDFPDKGPLENLGPSSRKGKTFLKGQPPEEDVGVEIQ